MRKEKLMVNTNRRMRRNEEDEQIKFQRKVIREEYVSNESVNKRAKELKVYL